MRSQNSPPSSGGPSFRVLSEKVSCRFQFALSHCRRGAPSIQRLLRNGWGEHCPLPFSGSAETGTPPPSGSPASPARLSTARPDTPAPAASPPCRTPRRQHHPPSAPHSCSATVPQTRKNPGGPSFRVLRERVGCLSQLNTDAYAPRSPPAPAAALFPVP